MLLRMAIGEHVGALLDDMDDTHERGYRIKRETQREYNEAETVHRVVIDATEHVAKEWSERIIRGNA